MDRKGRVVSLVIFGIIGILGLELFFWPFIATFFLSINANIALLLVLVSLIFKRYQIRRAQYVVFIILLLQSFNVVKFTFDILRGDYSETSFLMNVGSLSISPIPFVLLLIYSVVNKKTLKDLIKKILHATEQEQIDNRNKQVIFYYNKFTNCSDDELVDIYQMFKDYPDEAQEALKKIHTEKGLSILK